MSYRSTSLSVLNQWYWLPHPTLVYVPSQLISYDYRNAKFKTIHDEIIQIETSTLSTLRPTDHYIHETCHDLEELDQLDEHIMLYHLRKRYEQQRIYTNIGEILVYINPFEQVNIFNQNQMIKYHKSPPNMMNNIQSPHIYRVTQNCYNNVLTTGTNQSIIITGESGSGKTFNQHEVMSYLTTINASSDQQSMMNPILIENNGLNLLKAINILECFGNAHTFRNSNASRFGKWINVEIDNQSGAIIGCGFKHYLLETSRITEFPKGEKSLHVLESIRGRIKWDDVNDEVCDCRFLHPLKEN
eukprot:720208_1